MTEAILVTGATGKTGRRLVERLARTGRSHRAGSRNPAAGEIRFDWADAETWTTALDGVRAVYLVAPAGVIDVLGAMRPFIDQAVARGVERFVLLSASSLPEGGPLMGEVHAHLRQAAPRWTVLRPTWFMQNFSELQHRATIRDERRIYSATGDGRVGFIDAGDIAAVAAEALADPGFPDGDLVLTGAQTLSYSDVAAIVSRAVGGEVQHVPLSDSALAERFRAGGMPDGYARLLAGMDSAIAAGSEDRLTTSVADVTGRPPHDFETFAAAAVSAWR